MKSYQTVKQLQERTGYCRATIMKYFDRDNISFRIGRAIRFEQDKIAEVFNIIINNTAENEWFVKAHQGEQYITVDEANLDKILNNESFETYKKPVQRLVFRF